MLDLFCKMISRVAYNARYGKLHVEETGTQTKSSCKVDLEKRAWYDMNFGSRTNKWIKNIAKYIFNPRNWDMGVN